MSERPASGAGKYVLAAIAAAVIAHLAVIAMAPGLYTGAALRRIAVTSANHWTHLPRVTEATRDAKAPSADLASSTCLYDLARGPIRIRTTAWDDYASLSLYTDAGDDYYAVTDREAPRGVDLVLIKLGDAAPEHVQNVVESPTRRGVAIMRRLAPSAERFAAADRARRDDICAAFTP